MVLTAISQYPNKAFAGMCVGIDDAHDIESYINNAGIAAGVYDLVFTAVNTHTYTATIYGVPVSYLSDGSATLAEIRDGILAAIAAAPALTPQVSAAASGNNVRVTELAPDTYGPSGITGLDADTALTTVTAHGNTEQIPAGVFVARGPNFQDCRLIRASSDPIVGVTKHQHQAQRANKSSDALQLWQPNSLIPVVKRGRIWVIVEQAVALTDTPFVRFAAGAGGSQLGAIRKDADTASAATLSGKAKFMTAQATPGGLALLMVNIAP